MAVDGEGAPSAARAALLLRHRIFAGYQEKVGIIEVISYNEAGGALRVPGGEGLPARPGEAVRSEP